MEINTEEREILQKRFRDYISERNKGKECHDGIGIMVYPVVFDIDMGQQHQIKAVIEEIRTDSDYLENKPKPELPVAYFSVSGFVGRKVLQNVTEHTGLIVIDIDKKDNPGTDINELKNRFGRDKHILACFRSPSGGIKAVFNTDIRDKRHHKAYFHAISQYVLATYPEITKIDTSGSNINRACFMPHDAKAYCNPYCFKYCLDDQQITEITKEIKTKKLYTNSLKPILEVDDYSFDDHYENILYLLKNRTSIGIRAQKRTSVGMGENLDSTLPDIDTDEKRTSVGLYDCVFNKYRFNNIYEYIMSTDVPFFEMALWKLSYPHKLDYQTHIDENYFKDNTQKPLSTDKTLGFEDIDGLYFCEVQIPEDGIKIGFRHRTLASMSMKFIFNNPFLHPKRLVEHMQYINNKYCLDPHQKSNPKPSDEEVRNIVMYNYHKFICGELDFNKAIRKNNKNTGVMKKYVFHSRQYVDICGSYTKQRGHKCYTEGRLDKNVRRYAKAIKSLQNGTKITYKKIAKELDMTERHLRRIRGDINYQEFFEIQDKQIKDYNASLKKTIDNVLDIGRDTLENRPNNLIMPDPDNSEDQNLGLSDEEIMNIYHRVYSNILNELSSEKKCQLESIFPSKIRSFKAKEQRLLLKDASEVSDDDYWLHWSLESQLLNLITEIKA